MASKDLEAVLTKVRKGLGAAGRKAMEVYMEGCGFDKEGEAWKLIKKSSISRRTGRMAAGSLDYLQVQLSTLMRQRGARRGRRKF